MNASPLVSIIIPTYNNANLVCDAIDSSLDQTYPNKEVIVVDDGSNDGTGILLRKNYDKEIKYIFQENKGLSGARNTGIRNAAGKYLQFLDADDLLFKDKLTIQVKQLQNINRIAVAYCDYIRTAVDDATREYNRMSPELQIEMPFDDIITKWETELCIPPHCFLFDSALFKEYGISFDDSLPTHEDWECWMSIFALNPAVVFTDSPLANYRVRSDSMCADKLKMRTGYLMAIDKQIAINAGNRDVISKLKSKKMQTKDRYQDVSPLMEFMGKFHPSVTRLYRNYVPWRIQRLFF